MASYNSIYAPKLIINNIPIEYLPDTLTYKLGRGEANLRSLAGGGGTSNTVYSENVATYVGGVKFSVPELPEYIELINIWRSNKNQNVIALIDDVAGWSLTFQNAAIVNEPEHNPKFESSTEVEFKSSPAV